ncbi:phytoene desaturase [Macrococcus hajekii]|uniref:4,4'-diaponeurosporene oxygenase n=1 Tax=Macrococcus hajekii TaxID=198482 RepID=A0A4R6BJR9_9STAP|nr:phytoene desaturase family protein [Macrococcus hajekii]TDM01928.1 phytoene desaturase [Macrococcus hajekii]GGB08635.1 diapolycopene oxygenase [Macrococcus hajekii]
MKKVIVIGGGLGGLSVAITLRQQGFDVTLYEANAHLGGKLNRLEQEGFGFDLGPSILTMPYIFERLFERSDRRMEDYLKTVRLDLEWRGFFETGHIYNLYGDLDKMERMNPDLSKKDIEDYRRFLKYAGKIHMMTEKSYFEQGIDYTWPLIKHHGPMQALQGFDYFHTMQQGIDKRINNEEFRTLLGYFIKYVGSSSYDAPAVLNMMIHMQHAQGAWYVPGGMNRIAEALVKLGEEIGVKFLTRTRIVSADVEQGRISSVTTEAGEKLTADYFVSNMEVIPFYEKMLSKTPDIQKKKEKFEPAASGIVMHIGVNREYPQLAHHNFFFSQNSKKNFKQVFHDKKLPDDPTIYLVNTNKTDAGQAPAGHENIKILPHVPYIQEKSFTQAEYRVLRERVLIKLERMGLTDLRKHIVTEDFWMPEDIEKTYGSDRGAIYGTVSDKKKNKGFKHPKQSEYFNNLYFVGGTVNPGGGMPMVTLSGQQVGRMISEREQC